MAKIEKYCADEFTRKSGIVKTVVYINGDGKTTKMQTYRSDESAKKDGIVNKIFYFDSDDDEKTVKVEYYDKKGKLFLTKTK